MSLSPKAGPFTKFLITIAGVDEETLRQCPQHDWGNARAVGGLMVCTWLYQAGLFFLIAERLFASPGQFRPELMLPGMFLATFIMFIDSYMVMRSGWHLSGIEELKRGGLDISGGLGARIKAGLFLAIRILLSVGLAQLTAIFVSLIIFGADISARIRDVHAQANAPLIVSTAAMVDAEIKRATEAVMVQSARVEKLSAQVTAVRQNEIDPVPNDPEIKLAQQEVAQLVARKAKADQALQAAETFASDELAGIKATPANSGVVGNGPKRRAALEQVENAKKYAEEMARALDGARERLDSLRKQLGSAAQATEQRSGRQLPMFEQTLAAENAKLTTLKDQLSALTGGREGAIRKAVENSPDYVRPNDGLLAQIVALGYVANQDPKIAAVIILIDFTSFGFELAAVLAKVLSFVPTTYAALLARDAYIRTRRIVDGMVEDLDRPKKPAAEPEILPPEKPVEEPPRHNGQAPDGNPFEGPDDDPPAPPRRPRGRPRKNPPANGAKDASPRKGPGEPPPQLPPA